jgi:hypothetical protein
MSNETLNAAGKAKNDEFYTQIKETFRNTWNVRKRWL